MKNRLIYNPHPDQSFWKDEPDPQPVYRSLQNSITNFVKIYSIIFAIFAFGFGFGIFYTLSPTIAWIWFIFTTLLVGTGLYAGLILRHRNKIELEEIAAIQQSAIQRTGASHMGSAIHVAGYPNLEREQEIVLALVPPNLAIYDYKIDQPLAAIPLKDMISIQTVVYDDERIPHIDVIDSTAQALQVTIKDGEQEIICLFRRMKKVRPIDWYHALQKARAQL